MSLVITRKCGESVRIGNAIIEVKINSMNRVTLKITAPENVKIERPEKDISEKSLSTSESK